MTVVRQACLTALTSRVILTLSPTRMPPASRATFQVRPKSLRLIVVSPENPARVLPNGSADDALGLDRDRDGARHVLDGQVADELEVVTVVRTSRGHEGERRERLHVEEVGAAHVGVAVLVAGVDVRGVDRDLRGAAPGSAVEDEGAVEAGERAPDEMASDGVLGREKPIRRVRGVDGPGAGEGGESVVVVMASSG